jgi:diacylglycerol kinase
MEHYKRLFMSFTYAFKGIFRTVANERNLRIHLTCVVYMISILLFTDWFTLSRTDWAVLMLACSGVIGGEIVNTAIENAVNLASEEYTQYGKIAKDAAAGAVLVSAVFAVIVGFIILFQPEAFKAMYAYFTANIPMLVLLVLSIIPATLFIFFGVPIKKGKK